MPTLYNVNLKDTVEVPDSQLETALKSGKFIAPIDEDFRVYDPNGKSGTISGKELASALNAGFRVQTADEYRLEEEKKKYEDSPFLAGAAGAARGLTLGLSDVALAGSGLVEGNTLQGLKEFNPEASLGGELLGTIAPLALSGGTSLLARGATKAGAAVLGTELLAREAGKKVASSVASKIALSKIAEKSLGFGVQGAIEGAIFETGQIISEKALGAPDISAEALLQRYGASTLLGFGGAASLPYLGEGIKRAGQVSKKSLKELFPDNETVNRVIQGLSDIDQRFIKRARERNEEVKSALSFDEILSKAGTKVDELRESAQNLQLLAMDELATSGVTLDAKEVESFLRKYEKKINVKFQTPEMVSLGKNLQGIREKLDSEVLSPLEMKSLLTYITDAATPIYNNIKVGKDITSVEREILGLRFDVDSYLKTSVPEYKKIMGPLADYTESLKDVSSLLANKNSAIDRLKRAASQEKRIADRAVLENFSRLVSTEDAPFDLMELTLDRMALDAFNMPTTRGSKKTLMGAAIGSAVGAVFDGGLIGGAVGSAIGGTMDGAGGKILLDILGAQNSYMKPLRTIEESIKNFNKRIQGVTDSFFAPVKGQNPRVKSALTAIGAKGFNIDVSFAEAEEKLSRAQDYISGELNAFDEETALLKGAAPETQGYLKDRYIRALSLLNEKMPQRTPSFLPDEKDPYKDISQRDKSTFMRYFNAVNNPDQVLENISRGALIPEEIDTLRRVYPATFRAIQEKAIESIGKFKGVMPREKKNELSLLLGLKADPIHDPFNVRRLQDNFKRQAGTPGSSEGSPASGQKARRVPVSTLKSASGRLQLSTERLQTKN